MCISVLSIVSIVSPHKLSFVCAAFTPALVVRSLVPSSSSAANSPVDRAGYHIARTRLGFMANGLKSLKDRNVERVLASADQTLVDVAAELTPPSSKDLLRSLTRK